MANTLYGGQVDKNLPLTARIHTSQAIRQSSKLPNWMEDTDLLNRILSVYSDYLKRMPVNKLAERYEISPTQVYKDISRARQVAYWMFIKDLKHLVMEQVQRRQELVRDAQHSLAEVRATIKGPKRATAEAQLLRVIGENERAIEEIFGLRGSGKRANEDVINPPGSDSPNGQVIIDLNGEIIDTDVTSSDEPDAVPFEDEEESMVIDLDNLDDED